MLKMVQRVQKEQGSRNEEDYIGGKHSVYPVRTEPFPLLSSGEEAGNLLIHCEGTSDFS